MLVDKGSHFGLDGCTLTDLTRVEPREGYVDVVLLTKSDKHGGYCVAGIDLHTHAWVHLTTTEDDFPGGNGALGDCHLLLDDGSYAEVLDVVRFSNLGPCPELYQVENMLVDFSEPMKRLGKMQFRDVLKIHPAEGRKKLFYTNADTTPECLQDRLNYSLILAHVKDVVIYPYENKNGLMRAKADFTYVSRFASHDEVEYRGIRMTVPEYYQFGVGNRVYMDEAYFVLSVGLPYRGKIYKYVAAVYEPCGS